MISHSTFKVRMYIPSSRLNIPFCLLGILLTFLFMHSFNFYILSKVTPKSNENFFKTRNLNVHMDQLTRSYCFSSKYIKSDGV